MKLGSLTNGFGWMLDLTFVRQFLTLRFALTIGVKPAQFQ
jgi:hypothetical protein